MEQRPLAAIPDDELLRRLADLLRASRRVESELVAHIAEVDERRLYAREAAPSMFAYCTEVLHLSKAQAYLRIAVARASRAHPVLLSLLADGSLHLTGIALLAPHLTPERRDDLLRRSVHRSKRGIEELIAELAPRPDAPAVIRRLPARRDSGSGAEPLPAEHPAPMLQQCCDVSPGPAESSDPRPDRIGRDAFQLRPDGVGRVDRGTAPIQPLGLARYKVQFTASASLREKLERLRALMRPDVPDGDLAAIIDRLVTEKLERIEARRFAKTGRPRTVIEGVVPAPSSRRVPAAVRRAVHERDGNRCGYVDDSGRRCSEGHHLEYHHRHPYRMGGGHGVKNIGLVCRTHNAYLAELDYGREAMARHRDSAKAPGLDKHPPG
jgi:hypothetical protein